MRSLWQCIKYGLLKPIYRKINSSHPKLGYKILSMWLLLKERKGKPLPPYPRSNPLLLVEVSGMLENWRAGAGVQRVTQNVLSNLEAMRDDVLPVVCLQQAVVSTETPWEPRERTGGAQKQIELHEGDALFFLDSERWRRKTLNAVLDDAHKKNVRTLALFHDMFPVQYPEFYGNSTGMEDFRRFSQTMLEKSDALVCDSRCAADVVAAYYKAQKISRQKPLELHYIRLGFDIADAQGEVRETLRRFAEGGKTFLMVGTIEPRKGHDVAVKAFEKLPAGAARLLILGRDGWENDAIKAAIRRAEARGGTLWIKDATDAELHWAYRNSAALIAASKDEGFGLPLVEAAHFGLAIIASDIPIFREVSQGRADFFKVFDADSLAECLSAWLASASHPDSKSIRLYSWADCAAEINDILLGKREPYKTLDA